MTSRPLTRSRSVLLVCAALLIGAFAVALWPSGAPTTSERVESIAQQLRCIDCQGLSVAESDVKSSVTIRADIRERITRGQSDSEVLDAYEARFGRSILLNPTPEGVNVLLWLVPFGVVIGGAVGIAKAFARRTSSNSESGSRGNSGAIDVVADAEKRSTRVPTRRRMLAGACCLLVLIGAGVGIAARSDDSDPTPTVTRAERIRRFEDQVKKNPDAVSLRLAYARFLLPEDEPKALLQYVAAAKIEATNVEAVAYAGWLLYRVSGSVDAARASFDKARTLDDQYVDTLFFQGLLELQTGDVAVGKAALQQFLLEAPEHEYANQARSALASSVPAQTGTDPAERSE
jgi:cytochrome c-type biogenesis protein CcmH